MPDKTLKPVFSSLSPKKLPETQNPNPSRTHTMPVQPLTPAQLRDLLRDQPDKAV